MSNKFADIPEQKDFESDFKPVRFLKITPGIPIRVRVLDRGALRVTKHYLPSQKVSLVCLGEGVCPICINNRKLTDAEPGKPWNQVKGYIGKQNRFLVNVLNRTLVKVTPNGEVIYPGINGQFPPQHPETGEILTDIKAVPMNRVEVLERGSTLFSQLNAINETIVDEETGEPLGLWNYDVVISATGKGTGMVTNVVPQPPKVLNIEITTKDLYELHLVPLQLSPDEIYKVLNGVAVRDILAMRRETEKTDELGALEDSSSNAVSALFAGTDEEDE